MLRGNHWNWLHSAVAKATQPGAQRPQSSLGHSLSCSPWAREVQANCEGRVWERAGSRLPLVKSPLLSLFLSLRLLSGTDWALTPQQHPVWMKDCLGSQQASHPTSALPHILCNLGQVTPLLCAPTYPPGKEECENPDFQGSAPACLDRKASLWHCSSERKAQAGAHILVEAVFSQMSPLTPPGTA